MLKVKLRSSHREKNKATPIHNETTTVKLEKKSSKQKMKEYRDRLKENPDTYKAYLASEAERNRAYRARLDDQQRERQREKTRIRVQKFREKTKSAMILKTPQDDALVQPKTPKTRQKVKDQREYWRNKKKEQRKNMTAQKRRRVNEKRRLNYAEKRDKKLTTKEKEKEARTTTTGYKTKEAERKAVYRAKQSLPSSPNKFASVLAGIAASATPRKRAALENDGIILTPSKRRRLDMCSQSLAKITDEIQSKKYKRSKLALSRRRILASSIVWSSNTNMRKNCGMSWAFAYKCSKLKGVWTDKKRSDALDEDTIKKVEDFFRKPCNSRCLPDKKHVSKKTMEAKRILEVSLVDTYEKFKEQNTECNISFSKFSSLRPSNVKTMNKNAFNNCLCEYCTNIELKVKAIEKVVGNRSFVKNRYDISKETLCIKANHSQFYHKKCLERKCDKCGPAKFTKSLTDVLNKKSTTVEWHRWENQTIIHKGMKKTRKMLQMKKNNVTLFMAELAAEIGPFSAHLHNAAWQYEQFSTLIKNVPEKWVVFCMDFAENYTCLYQDEAQSAHWNHGQVTLFSIVAYYHCQSCSANMNESLIFITPDRKHDSHAVHCFNTIANEYLKRKKIVIDRQIHFSDGAASQFKSKTPFEDLRKGSDDFGFQIEKHFFGSRHGKGPCDGEFGVVKRTVSNAVKSRTTIVRTAEEFYMYAKGALTKPKDTDEKCCHTQRAFFLVEEKDIQRQRPDRINVKAIKDTRKKHGVKSLADGTLATRLLSCFCRECTTQNGTCINLEHVDDWESTSKKNKSVPLNKRDIGSKITDKTQKRNMIKKDENQGIKSKKNDNLRKKTKVPLNKKYVKRTSDEAVNDRFDIEWPKERSAYFQMVLLYLQSSESFDDLQAKCIEINESQMFHSYPFTVDKDIDIVTHNLAADRQAIDCMPRDGLALFSSMLPVCVVGDGNCLPRSASVACFGNETAHKEIRARIVVEMCLYKHQYVDNEYLNKGVDLPQKEAKNLVKTYAMFSEKYIPGDKITNEVISRIYDAEVSEIVKCGIFMGIWQLFALSSCANTRMYSVYPDLGAQLPRLTLNRQILPRNNLIQSSSKETPFVIMWSSTRTDMTRHNWVPNHFVPLIPSYHLKTPEVDIDFLEDGDEAFSLDDSVMMTLLQTVTDVEFDDNNDVVSDKNTDINTTTGDKPHDINGTTDGKPQDFNGSTVGETQDINGTTGDEPLEINGTSCGESQDINDTNGGKPQDINDTTCGETQDINGTTGDKPQDINYTTDGEPQDINCTTVGETKNINGATSGDITDINGASGDEFQDTNDTTGDEPQDINYTTDGEPDDINCTTVEENQNISDATDGVPQDIICITDGEPQDINGTTVGQTKNINGATSGDITGINGALGDEFQDTNDTTGDEPKDIKGTTDDKPQDINGTTDGENQNINGATDGESHIINSSPGDESQDINATTGNEPRDINATTGDEPIEISGITCGEIQNINGATCNEHQDIDGTTGDVPQDTNGTTGVELQDINGTTVDEPQDINVTPVDEPKVITATTGDEPQDINGTIVDEPQVTTATTGDEPQDINDTTDEYHKCINGLTHDENTGINGAISDEHKTFNCRKEDDQHRLQNGHGSSFIQKRVQLIRHVLGG